ncbi:tetratricopeptide repeat protein [Pseudomonas sp. YQ_13]|uniref:tetratricopeptide repeat protein n=1 Tax=Pseudomonas sp. YQ_13 TaxID=3367235 RepID=UPI00370A3D22
MASPETISKELTERLNALSRRDNPKEITEIEKFRFKKDIEALKKIDFGEGMMALAIFCAIIGEEENSIDAHKRACDRQSYNPIYHNNFAITLTAFGWLNEAFDYCAKSVRLDPSNPRFIHQAGELAICIGRLEEYLELVSLHFKATQDESIMKRDSSIIAQDVLRQLKALDVSDKDLNYAYLKVESICRKHGVPIMESIFGTNVADEHRYLSVNVRVNCSGQKLSQMNSDLSDLIAEDFEFAAWNTIIHTFTHTERKKRDYQS